MKNLINAATIVLAMLSMSNSSCDKGGIEGVQNGRFGSPIALGLNEKAIFSEGSKGMVLTVNSLADSRCAKDVQCVWAGNAQVQIQLRAADGTDGNLDLCIGQCGKELKQADTALLTLADIRYTIILSEVNDSNKAVFNVTKN